MRSMIATLAVLAIAAGACGGSSESRSPTSLTEEATIATTSAVPPTVPEFIPETRDGRPFLDLDLDEKISAFLGKPNTIFAANIAGEMGLTGNKRWAPWLLDIILLSGTATASDQGLRALSTLSGIAETDNPATDFAVFGGWQRTEGIDPGPGYEEWKTGFYASVLGDEYMQLLGGIEDPITLAAIQWGGVRRGDIPELNDPVRISVAEATFMTAEELVLGVVVDGVAVAYPERFLGRHELANDHIAGRPVSLIYCTLCRSAILFDRVVGDLVLDFQTSGLLLDSNKVMVDVQTDTLWHHLTGLGIAGQLKGVTLERFPVETTTWEDWVAAHPDTETLATPPPTIFVGNPERPPLVYDYTPGSAYKTYNESKDLWFPAITPPPVFEPKEEVGTIEINGASLAFSIAAVADAGITVLDVGDNAVLIVPTSGGVRAYDARDTALEAGSTPDVATSTATEAVLGNGTVLPRILSGQSFWFAWYGIHPDTSVWPTPLLSP